MLEACPPYQASYTRDGPDSLNQAHHQTLRTFPPEGLPKQGHNAPGLGSSANNKTSLDFTQRFERKLAEYNASQNVFKRWLFEITSWLVSAVSMGAIIGIYMNLQNTRMSQAGTLLTYTNVLGKIASAALIVPTTEALGQLKWNWFQKSKAMWDFEIFDKATRYMLICSHTVCPVTDPAPQGSVGSLDALVSNKGQVVSCTRRHPYRATTRDRHFLSASRVPSRSVESTKNLGYNTPSH
jgi:hypothetical protein